MKTELGHPYAALHGHMKGSLITHIVRNGQTFIQGYTKPKKRNSPDQRTARAFQVAAARHWGTLAPAQLRQWQDYAEHLNELRLCSGRGAELPKCGWKPHLLFCQVQFLRQCMGLQLCADAPTLDPPPAVGAITPEPTDQPTEFRYRITHPIADPHGFVVRFDITDAMPSTGRTPREKELRMISHTGPESFLSLQPSGALYNIVNARFAILPGSRYGLRITILTSEGVPGPGLTVDLIR